MWVVWSLLLLVATCVVASDDLHDAFIGLTYTMGTCRPPSEFSIVVNEPSVANIFNDITRLWSGGQIDEAMALVPELLSLDRHPTVLQMMGNLYIRSHNLDAGADLLSEAWEHSDHRGCHLLTDYCQALAVTNRVPEATDCLWGVLQSLDFANVTQSYTSVDSPWVCAGQPDESKALRSRVERALGHVYTMGESRPLALRVPGATSMSLSDYLSCALDSKPRLTDYFRWHVRDFFGEDAGTKKVHRILRRVQGGQGPITLVDIGAADFGWAADRTDTYYFAELWNGTQQLRIDAFEPVGSSFRDLQKKVSEWGISSVVNLYQQAVSDEPGVVQMSASEFLGAVNTYKPIDERSRGAGRDIPIGETVESVTLDQHFRAHPAENLFYIKVDVEGFEYNVLRGMKETLRNHRVPVMTFEYAVFWSKTTFLIAKEKHPPAMAVGDMDEPTLRSFVRELYHMQYETFFISQAALIPISGVYWDDFYEVCNNPITHFNRTHCWTDVVVIDIHWPLREAFLEAYHVAEPPILRTPLSYCLYPTAP
eukprot:Rmarinus@m.7856